MKRKNRKIDVSEWGLFSYGYDDSGWINKKLLAKEVSLAIEATFKDFPPELDFPIRYVTYGEDGRGGKAPKNPLTMYLELNLGEDEDKPVTWEITLNELLSEMINERKEDGSWDDGLRLISRGLRDLVNQIDAACSKKIEVEEEDDNSTGRGTDIQSNNNDTSGSRFCP